MTSKEFQIAVFAGDGVGPEIMKEALKVLKVISDKNRITLGLTEGSIGGSAYDISGVPLPDESLNLALHSDAVLLGAVGGPKWEGLDYSVRPERALLGLREKLGLYANLRPVVVFDELLDASPLKKEVVQGIDIMILRELTGDVYFGQPRGVTIGKDGKRVGVNTMIYTEDEIRRIAVRAFELARGRKKNLLSVDKANVLETTELWRTVVTEVGRDYPDVTLKHMYVDNCAMQLIRNPSQFDVIVTTNLFGDILSDEAAMLTGSIGMLPSASLGKDKALYEPIHGSAPDIAGKNIANPLATILSVAMMLRYSLNLPAEAALIEKAVADVLKDGFRTQDIYSAGSKLVGTEEMGNAVVRKLEARLDLNRHGRSKATLKGKILIVDDESSVRELFSGVFTDEGYEVIAAEDGNQALDILKQDNIDVIFLDLKLFGMNGIDLCRQIRETKPVSMIFAVTGWAPLFEIEECREAGFDDYFEKPLDMDMLLSIVADAFKKLERWKIRYHNIPK